MGAPKPTCRSLINISCLLSTVYGGGEGGIRTLSAPVESVTYRVYIANVAVDASAAVGPCSFLPDEMIRLTALQSHRTRDQMRPSALSASGGKIAQYSFIDIRSRCGGFCGEAVCPCSTLSQRVANQRGGSILIPPHRKLQIQFSFDSGRARIKS